MAKEYLVDDSEDIVDQIDNLDKETGGVKDPRHALWSSLRVIAGEV